MRSILLSILVTTACLHAQTNTHCRQIGGGILTNLIDSTDTLGTATGDLKGGLGVQVLSQDNGPNGNITLHVHHHWVTETGETVLFDNANVTIFPSGISGLYAASYLEGIRLSGGTGRFKDATGRISAWGAVDFSKKQLTLRYRGTVCVGD